MRSSNGNNYEKLPNQHYFDHLEQHPLPTSAVLPLSLASNDGRTERMTGRQFSYICNIYNNNNNNNKNSNYDK